MNASDDRNAATVSSRIKNAIEAGSGLGDAGRPVCVVVDEIDGATGGGDTVRFFVESWRRCWSRRGIVETRQDGRVGGAGLGNWWCGYCRRVRDVGGISVHAWQAVIRSMQCQG